VSTFSGSCFRKAARMLRSSTARRAFLAGMGL
jgi:hypothetical protein